MADGYIQFHGDIDFRTGSNSSITTCNSFGNRSDIGKATYILVTNGDNVLKRITCVDTETLAVSMSKITGRTQPGHKTFTHVTESKPPPTAGDSITIAGFTGDNAFLNGIYEGNVVSGYDQTSPANGGEIRRDPEVFDAGAPGITNYGWGIIDGNTTTTSTVNTNTIDRTEADGTLAILPPYNSAFTMGGGISVTATSPYHPGQVKWEVYLPRFKSIALQKGPTDQIYVQKNVLAAKDGTFTITNGTNFVVTPINQMYKDTHRVHPLPGHGTTAAGFVNRTNLNKAKCFLASFSGTSDGDGGRCIVLSDAAGNQLAKTMIPGFSYMKIFKRPTDTIHCEQTLFSDSSANVESLVNMRFSPIGITE